MGKGRGISGRLDIIIGILCWLVGVQMQAQGTGMVYEKIVIPEKAIPYVHCDIDLVPGRDLYAVSSTQSFPFQLINSETFEPVATHDLGNWMAGSRIECSSDGKYILLRQLLYLDLYPKKNRSLRFELIETEGGKVLISVPSAQSALIHPDNQQLIVLEDGVVYSYPLNGGNKKSLFSVAEASNCLAVSPDGSEIAVSHWPEDGFLDTYLTKKNQRKNFKIYKKYRQCISVYDTESKSRLYTAEEMTDLPYDLSFSPDGKVLLCYAIPHMKMTAKSGQGNSRYISKIDAATGKSLPGGFVSNSPYEPDFEFSHDGKYIALLTVNGRYPEAWVCDFESSKILARFEISGRLFEGLGNKEFSSDAGRTGLAFSSDDKHLLLTSGSVLIKWTIPHAD